MKKLAMILSVATMLVFTSCADNADKNGEAPVDEPVMNSGPETEAERAKDAVKDSADAGADSTVQRDADAPSSPH